MEVVWDHAHLLLGISPGETPEEAALALLNNTEHWFHDRYSAAMKQEGLDTVFHAGYYAGTCGEVARLNVNFLRCKTGGLFRYDDFRRSMPQYECHRIYFGGLLLLAYARQVMQPQAIW